MNFQSVGISCDIIHLVIKRTISLNLYVTQHDALENEFAATTRHLVLGHALRSMRPNTERPIDQSTSAALSKLVGSVEPSAERVASQPNDARLPSARLTRWRKVLKLT